MDIECLASDYVVKEKAGIYYVYNELYEESLISLVIASLFNFFLPEAFNYYIPISIEITQCNGPIVVGKKLEIIGSAKFKYFIAKHQYEKWKIVYRIMQSIIYILCLIIEALFIYWFFKTNYPFVMIVCIFVMNLFIICANLKLIERKKKKYPAIDIEF